MEPCYCSLYNLCLAMFFVIEWSILIYKQLLKFWEAVWSMALYL